MRVLKILQSITIMLVLITTSANAETIQLSEMDGETKTYIQRSNPFPTVECYNHLIDFLLKRGHTEKDIWVSFDEDDGEQIGVGFDGTDENYSCTDGELRSWDFREYQVLKRF